MSTIALSDISQSPYLEKDTKFDFALGYVGQDRRSIANLLDALSCTELMWAFTSVDCAMANSSASPDLVRRKISKNLSELRGATNMVVGPEAEAALRGTLESMGQSKTIIKLLVDTSAFPRRVLASLLNMIRNVVASGISIELTIGYRLAEFSRPSEEAAPPNKRVAPVHPDLAGWPKLPGLPVHLIVGLGYEQGKALGAVEYIQPTYVSLFSPLSPEPRFAEEVHVRNQPLLINVDSSAVFSYQVLEPAAQIAQLSSMLASLVRTRRPVLLPFGPKIFFAVCVLLSFGFPEVSVWHVSGEEQDSIETLKPSKHSAYMTLTLGHLASSN